MIGRVFLGWSHVSSLQMSGGQPGRRCPFSSLVDEILLNSAAGNRSKAASLTQFRDHLIPRQIGNFDASKLKPLDEIRIQPLDEPLHWSFFPKRLQRII